MIPKLCKLNGAWQWIVFSDDEEREMRKAHRVHCNTTFSECMEDAKIILNEPTIISLNVIEVASALFSKRADAVYSALQKEVDKVVCEMQKGGK